VSAETERAVRIAALGNIRLTHTDSGYENTLDAAQFIQDLYDSGWEVVGRKMCTVQIWHGPGHQSRTTCEARGPHNEHYANLYGEHMGIYEWEGGDVFAEYGGGTHPKEK
jgi:hypothetical protein